MMSPISLDHGPLASKNDPVTSFHDQTTSEPVRWMRIFYPKLRKEARPNKSGAVSIILSSNTDDPERPSWITAISQSDIAVKEWRNSLMIPKIETISKTDEQCLL